MHPRRNPRGRWRSARAVLRRSRPRASAKTGWEKPHQRLPASGADGAPRDDRPPSRRSGRDGASRLCPASPRSRPAGQGGFAAEPPRSAVRSGRPGRRCAEGRPGSSRGLGCRRGCAARPSREALSGGRIADAALKPNGSARYRCADGGASPTGCPAGEAGSGSPARPVARPSEPTGPTVRAVPAGLPRFLSVKTGCRKPTPQPSQAGPGRELERPTVQALGPIRRSTEPPPRSDRDARYRPRSSTCTMACVRPATSPGL